MRTRNVLGLVFLGMLLGCVVKDVYFPRADAQVPKVRWEYRCISDVDTSSLTELVGQLNKAGGEGWELAATGNRTSTTSHFCLKRPF